MKYLILGGDQRSVCLFTIFKERGLDIRTFGFTNYSSNSSLQEIKYVSDLGEEIQQADIIIGPIPFCKGGYINAPFYHDNFYHDKIPVEKIFSYMHSGQILFGGLFYEDSLKLASDIGIQIFDLLKREEMAVKNAIPTAEGALQIALENTDFTINSSHVLVMGFGRVGKILSKILYGLGAKVTVSARKPEDLAFINVYGYDAQNYSELSSKLGEMDIIFNTVPHIILDKTNIGFLKSNVLIIELASKPFGIDIAEGIKAGLKILFAPSLPGKAAPLTAAKYIFEIIETIMNERS